MSLQTIVYKLGEISQCIQGYNNLSKIISEKTNDDVKHIVVLSAIAGVTDNLVNFTDTKNMDFIKLVFVETNKLFENIFLNNKKEYNSDIIYQKSYDIINCILNNLNSLCEIYIKKSKFNDIYMKSSVIGFGEIISTNLLYIYFLNSNIKSLLLNSYDYIFSKKEIYQFDSLSEFYAKKIDFHQYNDYNIFILQGFIASTPSGKTILLSRGGSDTTGSLLANSHYANHYEIWTNIDGIYTGNPKKFKNAKIVNKIDYVVCQELSAMGAKVMYPLSIKPCADLNIPIYIRDTFTMNIGTCICNNYNQEELFYAIQQNQTMFKIKSLNMWNSYGFATDIFKEFSNKNIDIDIVTTSQFSITITTAESDIYKLMEINDIFKEKYIVEMTNDCVILSFIKKNIKKFITPIYKKMGHCNHLFFSKKLFALKNK